MAKSRVHLSVILVGTRGALIPFETETGRGLHQGPCNVPSLPVNKFTGRKKQLAEMMLLSWSAQGSPTDLKVASCEAAVVVFLTTKDHRRRFNELKFDTFQI